MKNISKFLVFSLLVVTAFGLSTAKAEARSRHHTHSSNTTSGYTNYSSDYDIISYIPTPNPMSFVPYPNPMDVDLGIAGSTTNTYSNNNNYSNYSYTYQPVYQNQPIPVYTNPSTSSGSAATTPVYTAPVTTTPVYTAPTNTNTGTSQTSPPQTGSGNSGGPVVGA